MTSFRTPSVVILCLVCLTGSLLTTEAEATAASAAQAPNACFAAGSATNAVIHFYLAVDQRWFKSAYQCFDAAEMAQQPFATFKKSFAHTIAAHLVYADDLVPNGQPAKSVAVKVAVFNHNAGVTTRTEETGSWQADPSHQLSGSSLTSSAPVQVSTITPTSPKAIFAARKLTVMRQMWIQETGPGSKDHVYFTAREPCGECRSQQLWIYDPDRLVYQQELDNPQLIPWQNHLAIQVRTDTPGTPGVGTAHPSSRTYISWFWTQFGFVLHSRKVVKF